jgi:hypothetical protein
LCLSLRHEYRNQDHSHFQYLFQDKPFRNDHLPNKQRNLGTKDFLYQFRKVHKIILGTPVRSCFQKL